MLNSVHRPLRTGKSYQLRFTNDGLHLVSFARDLALWNLTSKKKIAFAHPLKHPAFVDISPNGDSLIVKSTSGSVCHASIPEFRTLRSFEALSVDSDGCEVVFSPCGENYVDGSWDGVLCVRRLSDGHVVFREHYPGVRFVRLSTTINRNIFAYVLQPIAKRPEPPEVSRVAIRKWPFDQHVPSYLNHNWGYVHAVALSWDGSRLAVQQTDKSGGHTLQVHSLQRGGGPTLTGSVVWRGTSWSIAWSPDGNYIACVEDGQASLFDATTLNLIAKHQLPYPCHVEFSHDGKFLAVRSWEKGVVIAVFDLISSQ